MRIAAMPEKLTIQDIATLAGVSKATVSRVLNNKPDVDPETRENILRIVRERGFTRSAAASATAGGRTGLIGMLVPSLTWSLMPEILRGVADIVEQTSYELVLYSISHERDRNAVIDRILETKLTEGLLAVFPDSRLPGSGNSGDDDHRVSRHLTELYEQGLPIVMIDDQGLPTSAPWVGADNRIGAYAATKHLIDLGHTRIAHIKGRERYLCSSERYDGYRDALLDAGLALDPALVLEGDFTPVSGHACAGTLLALDPRPTAVFVGNDDMAYGVLSAAEERTVKVPDELAIVGFDDAAPAAHMRPTLTTVRQPFFEMGQTATELLLSMLDGPSHQLSDRREWQATSTQRAPLAAGRHPVRIQLPTGLVIRESCGAGMRKPALVTNA
jgi:LacI family transcriptional regulator